MVYGNLCPEAADAGPTYLHPLCGEGEPKLGLGRFEVFPEVAAHRFSSLRQGMEDETR